MALSGETRSDLQPIRAGFDQVGFLINLLLFLPMGLATLKLLMAVFQKISLIPAFQIIIDIYANAVGAPKFVTYSR